MLRRGRALAPVGWVLVGLACHGAPSARAPERERSSQPASVAAAPAQARAAGRSVRVRVALGSGDAGAIAVELELVGASAELAELRLSSTAHGALGGLELSDGGGALPFVASELDHAW